MPNLPRTSFAPVPEAGETILNAIRYAGEPNVPRNIRRQRANTLDTLRRVGAPVIVKHMYNDRDVQEGIAEPSPNFSSVYKQPRHGDPVSHGVGFVSVEKSTDEWVSPDGLQIVSASISPGPGFIPAPRYRGYGPGYLIYCIMPDVSEDVFKLTEAGVLIRTQQAQASVGWFPEVNDNDLLITCEIDNQERILQTYERYLLKQTTPTSMRGLDRKGRRERDEDFGNRHVTDQNFEMTLIPKSDPLYQVEVDR